MVSLSAEVFLAKLFPQKGHLFSTLISWVAGAARALQMLCKALTPPAPEVCDLKASKDKVLR
jgi:hypothetical protein